MRARLQQAVDELCDGDLHERLWLRGQRVSPTELGFDDTLLFLVDEMEMFGPDDLVGDILIDDFEFVAFKELTSAVETLIEAIGKRGSYADAVASGAPWESCVARAQEMQRRLDMATGRSKSSGSRRPGATEAATTRLGDPETGVRGWRWRRRR
jgi:hypothetical protein